MDFSKFKETEQQYKDLKEKLSHGEISPEDMKKELKKMMVLDEKGNYWMIGGKTGKWYAYNGTEWKEGNPFLDKSQSTAIHTIYTESAEEYRDDDIKKSIVKEGSEAFIKDENKKEYEYEHEHEYEYEHEDEEPFKLDVTSGPLTKVIETSSTNVENARMETLDEEQDSTDRYTICKICKSKISIYSIYCPVCGANQKEAAMPPRKADRSVVKENELLLASVKITSLIFFMGGLGLILGVFCGAAFGIFKTLIPEFQPLLPDMLSETRGGIAGGLIFAAVGGIAAFTISAFSAGILGIAYNIISFIFGGIRFKIKQ